MFSRILTGRSTKDCSDNIENKAENEKEQNKINAKTGARGKITQTDLLSAAIDEADAVIIGAGAGLSTSAGFTYSGERFEKYFADFEAKYGFHDMYTGGFCQFESMAEYWAFWSRYIYINRYMDPPKDVYGELLALVRDKDYFVLTTNVDHCFQKTGFDKKRLFYTQGDYGLFQCSEPCHDMTYDNEETIRKMVLSQGYEFAENGEPVLAAGRTAPEMEVPEELIPRCPRCGKLMSMNLRCDNTFVEDAGWKRAFERYSDFIRRHAKMRVVLLELGTGMNTPGIIKYPFWQMTAENRHAVYVCINYGEAFAPDAIKDRSICINDDIGEILTKL